MSTAKAAPYRVEQRPDGLRIVSDRGAVCEMLAGYQQTREADAAKIVALLNEAARHE